VAAAILALGFLVLNRSRLVLDAPFQLGALIALLAIALHLSLNPDRRERRLLLLIPTTVLTWVASVGVFLLVLVGGGCGDHAGDIGVLSWFGGAVIYVAGSAWALQRPLRAVVFVPASLLAGGVWLVVTATLISGGTGACLD
jgi:hypothetical protein